MEAATKILKESDNAKNNWLCNFDFSLLEESDPATYGGWQLIYNRELPCEIRYKGKVPEVLSGIGTVESIRLKILVKGAECKPTEVKVEMISDKDLFLHYIHKCSPSDFNTISQSQKLLVNYNDYPTVLMKSCNSAIKEAESYATVAVLSYDGTAELKFVQNIHFKFVELLTLPFSQSPEDEIRKSISFRHNLIRSKLAMLYARLSDVGALLKTKNPQLLQQLEKCANVLSSACPPILPS